MHSRAPSHQAIAGLGGLPRGWAITVGCSCGDAGVLGTIIIVVFITCQREEEPIQQIRPGGISRMSTQCL